MDFRACLICVQIYSHCSAFIDQRPVLIFQKGEIHRSLKGGFHGKNFFFVLISNNTFMGIDFRKTIEEICKNTKALKT